MFAWEKTMILTLSYVAVVLQYMILTFLNGNFSLSSYVQK